MKTTTIQPRKPFAGYQDTGRARESRFRAFCALLALAAVVMLPGRVEAQMPAEGEILGHIVVNVARDGGGDDYGYQSGSFGTLISGTWPPHLFEDGSARTVDSIHEDADGYWYWAYSGGATADWSENQDELDTIVVNVSYASGKDARTFVLGGFVAERVGDYTLKLDPPLPSRDWDARAGEDVTIAFTRRQVQMAATSPTPLSKPTATAPTNSVDLLGRPNDMTLVKFLNETVPGGPVTFQTMVTILVFAIFLYKTPSTPRGILMTAIVLILTPWAPVIIGYGDPIAAAIVFVNVCAGAYAYNHFVAARSV